jgi:hypothetical protein
LDRSGHFTVGWDILILLELLIAPLKKFAERSLIQRDAKFFMLRRQIGCWHRRNCNRLGVNRIMIRIRFPERKWC